MDPLLTEYTHYLPPTLRGLPWRTFPQDGALLLFERDSGLNLCMEGAETAHLRALAPRSLLIAVTNHCNLRCPFCYRDQSYPSAWTTDSLMQFCLDADAWGVLEVAFGGGEPMLFPHWAEFICELYERSRLAINFTSNGTLIRPDFLRQVKGKLGQIRISLYEDNEWRSTLRLLAEEGARFGVNWLISPAELPEIEARFAELLGLGVRDFLLIGYKGQDPAMHLSAVQVSQLSAFIRRAHAALGSSVTLKIDSCWGKALDVPRLFEQEDCGAGADFLSITSHRQVKPCSFHHLTIPFETFADLRAWWEAGRARRIAAAAGGCARLPQRGLSAEGAPLYETLTLAAVGQ